MVTALRDWGVREQELWEILADQPLRPFTSPYPFSYLFLSFVLKVFVPRLNHGLQRPNPHDCRVEGGYVLPLVRAVLWWDSAIRANNWFSFDIQAPMPLRERAKLSPTSMLVSLCNQQSKAHSARTVVTSCLWTPMADKLSQMTELQ